MKTKLFFTLLIVTSRTFAQRTFEVITAEILNGSQSSTDLQVLAVQCAQSTNWNANGAKSTH